LVAVFFAQISGRLSDACEARGLHVLKRSMPITRLFRKISTTANDSAPRLDRPTTDSLATIALPDRDLSIMYVDGSNVTNRADPGFLRLHESKIHGGERGSDR